MKKITLLLVCLFAGFMANAQWNTDTAINTLVADSETGDSMSRMNSNGETFVVFWKEVASPTNYELRLQKLNASGEAQFGNEGVLISNTIPMGTFTQQWSFTLDASGNLYVGVTGTNGNGGFAFKLDSNGNNLWGDTGVSLGTGYVVRILPLSSGEAIVTWLSGSFDGNIQKFDSNGTPVWTNPINVGSATVPANSYELSDGSFITIYHQLLSGITSKMFAQRFDASGTSQWATSTQLFADGNNTTYNTPYFGVQDGDVIYYSYKLAHNNRFDAYVQRINPDGSLPWGITGMDFDTNQTNYEQEIQIATEVGTQYVYALCRYTDSSQGQIGIYLQKFDKTTGARQFTDNALEVYPISNSGISPAGDFRLIGGQPVFLTTGTTNSLNINLLNENGAFVWVEHAKSFATFNASKGRINLHVKSNSELVGTFAEDKGSGQRAYAQNFTDAALSIDDETIANTLQFINPIQNELKLKSSQNISSVEVYNTLGQLINHLKNNQSNELTINAQNWNAGMYLVIVTIDNGNKESLKIIKK